MGNRKSKAAKQGYERKDDKEEDLVQAVKDQTSRTAPNEDQNGTTVKDRRNSDSGSDKDEGSPNAAPIINKFGMKLYRAVKKERKGDENFFFSPLSISAALAMTYKGARGDTAKQIDKVMKLSSLSDDAFANLSSELISSDQYQIKVASRLYGQKGLKFYLKYLASDSHGVPLETIDFLSGSKATVEKMNIWVEDQTSGKIQEIVAPRALSSDTRLLLVDALYFHSEWLAGFDPDATKELPFRSPSDKITIPMMYREGIHRIYHDDDLNCKVLSMPYKGGQVSMLIALPDEIKDLDDLEDDLDEDKLKSWNNNMQAAKCKVTIPKFTFSKSVSLVPYLKRMGIEKLFDKADLSGIAREDTLSITDVIHKAVLTVDEKGGSEAPAVPESEDAQFAYTTTEEFKADHPFVIFIYDQTSEAVIFMGCVKRPEMG